MRPAARLPKLPLGTRRPAPAAVGSCEPRPRVIDHLRQQTADVDRVGRRERARGPAGRVGRTPASPAAGSRRRSPATATAVTLPPSVVNCASWTALTCPCGYSTTTRVPRHAVERLGHGAAGVPRRRHQHRQRRASGLPSWSGPSGGPCTRAPTSLKAGRAVKQFEHDEPRGERARAALEIERLGEQALSVGLAQIRRRRAAPAAPRRSPAAGAPRKAVQTAGVEHRHQSVGT